MSCIWQTGLSQALSAFVESVHYYGKLRGLIFFSTSRLCNGMGYGIMRGHWRNKDRTEVVKKAPESLLRDGVKNAGNARKTAQRAVLARISAILGGGVQ